MPETLQSEMVLEQLNAHLVPEPLTRAITESWSATSSKSNRWRPESRALGQCVVTALTLQDHMGGSIVRASVFESYALTDVHFYNMLPNGEVDLTRQQFPSGTKILSELRETDMTPSAVRTILLQDYRNRLLYEFFSSGVRATLRSYGRA